METAERSEQETKAMSRGRRRAERTQSTSFHCGGKQAIAGSVVTDAVQTRRHGCGGNGSGGAVFGAASQGPLEPPVENCPGRGEDVDHVPQNACKSVASDRVGTDGDCFVHRRGNLESPSDFASSNDSPRG